MIAGGPAVPIAALGQDRALGLYNRVMPFLVAAGGLAIATSGFLSLAPNRLLSGRAIGLFAALDPVLSLAIVVLGIALLSFSLFPPRPALHRAAAAAAAAAASALLLIVLAAAGAGANALATTAPSVARISLGAGFWLLAGAAALAIVDGLQRAAVGPAARIAVAASIAGAAAAMAHAGLFEALSLVREYRVRESQFTAALLRHILLVAGAVGPAVLIGLPLGVYLVRRPQRQGGVFAVLNLLQTIPSVALFGLLILPLSALAEAVPALAAFGIGGIGAAPAIIALILYALLPVARNSVAGLSGVDRGVVEAARGMGMSPAQLFWRVELPLAAPLLLAGLRIVTVQAIGLAVVAALIGAGGLGAFVFEGLGQYAADLVLLGALPTIGLALAIDFFLASLSAILRPR